MLSRITTGIDVGTRLVRVVIAESERKNAEFRIIGQGTAPSFGLQRGYIVNADEARKSIGDAIKAAEKSAKTRVRHAYVSLGGVGLSDESSSASVIISHIDGEINNDDVNKVLATTEESIDLANKRVVHRLPLEYKIDGKEVLGRPTGMRGMKLSANVLFVTCLSQHLEDLLHAIELNGVEVEDLVAAPIAESVTALSKRQRVAGCILADIGAETVSTAVFEKDRLISIKVFPLGLTDIISDIALGLKIPLEEAEESLKENMTTGTTERKQIKRKLEDIVEARLKDIFESVSAHLKKLERDRLLPAGIVLSGSGASLPKIEEVARASLNLPAQVAGIPPLSSKVSSDDPAVFSIARGLCILGFDESYESDLARPNTPHLSAHLKKIASWFGQFKA